MFNLKVDPGKMGLMERFSFCDAKDIHFFIENLTPILLVMLII